jgi:hypothetical protein
MTTCLRATVRLAASLVKVTLLVVVGLLVAPIIVEAVGPLNQALGAPAASASTVSVGRLTDPAFLRDRWSDLEVLLGEPATG